MMSLVFAPFGQELEIKKITVDEKTARHLTNLGIIVGSKIMPLSGNNGDIILKVKDGRIALNRSLALKIQVA